MNPANAQVHVFRAPPRYRGTPLSYSFAFGGRSEDILGFTSPVNFAMVRVHVSRGPPRFRGTLTYSFPLGWEGGPVDGGQMKHSHFTQDKWPRVQVRSCVEKKLMLTRTSTIAGTLSSDGRTNSFVFFFFKAWSCTRVQFLFLREAADCVCSQNL